MSRLVKYESYVIILVESSYGVKQFTNISLGGGGGVVWQV